MEKERKGIGGSKNTCLFPSPRGTRHRPRDCHFPFCSRRDLNQDGAVERAGQAPERNVTSPIGVDPWLLTSGSRETFPQGTSMHLGAFICPPQLPVGTSAPSVRPCGIGMSPSQGVFPAAGLPVSLCRQTLWGGAASRSLLYLQHLPL